MTEAERVARLLARRLAAAGFPDPVLGSDLEHCYLMLDTTSRTGLKVFLCLWLQPGGQVRDALSFVFDGQPSMMGKHLNNWRRPEGDFTVPQLVDKLWEAFWAHEEENRALNRLQWMHLSKLPDLDEEVPSGPSLLDAASHIDKPQRKRKKTPIVPDEHTTVFDLFKE